MCQAWASRGECSANAGYMHHHCARACSALPPPSPRWPSDEEAAAAAAASLGVALESRYSARLGGLLNQTFTQACRDEVVGAFADHAERFFAERPMPFQV